MEKLISVIQKFRKANQKQAARLVEPKCRCERCLKQAEIITKRESRAYFDGKARGSGESLIYITSAKAQMLRRLGEINKDDIDFLNEVIDKVQAGNSYEEAIGMLKDQVSFLKDNNRKRIVEEEI